MPDPQDRGSAATPRERAQQRDRELVEWAWKREDDAAQGRRNDDLVHPPASDADVCHTPVAATGRSACPNCGATDWTLRIGLGDPRRDGKLPLDVCNVCHPATMAGRRSLWQRIKRPASSWPCRYTREVPFWHPWHVGAALSRLRFRYLYWRGY